MNILFSNKPNSVFLLLLAVLFFSFVSAVGAQSKSSAAALKTAPSKYKLAASGAHYEGIKASRYLNDESSKERIESLIKYQIGDSIYYERDHLSNVDSGGLAMENTSDGTARIFPMFRLAEAVGWYKPKKGEESYPDATRGLFLVGDKLYMGSNGVGIAVFDTKQKTWSRYDDKPSAVPGAHVQLYLADEDYMFLTDGEFPSAALHIYSMKLDKWLKLAAVPNQSIVELGHNGSGLAVQVFVDDRIYAKAAYMPIDWHLAMLSKVSAIDDNTAYLFERNYFENSRTAYKITKSQLEEAFLAKQQK